MESTVGCLTCATALFALLSVPGFSRAACGVASMRREDHGNDAFCDVGKVQTD
jgi:hypothetical protein